MLGWGIWFGNVNPSNDSIFLNYTINALPKVDDFYQIDLSMITCLPGDSYRYPIHSDFLKPGDIGNFSTNSFAQDISLNPNFPNNYTLFLGFWIWSTDSKDWYKQGSLDIDILVNVTGIPSETAASDVFTEDSSRRLAKMKCLGTEFDLLINDIADILFPTLSIGIPVLLVGLGLGLVVVLRKRFSVLISKRMKHKPDKHKFIQPPHNDVLEQIDQLFNEIEDS